VPFGPWPGGVSGAGSAWAAEAQEALSNIVPGLVFAHSKPNNHNQATLAATPTIDAHDANILGGGIYPDTNQYATYVGTIYTDLLTQPYGWAFRGMIGPPSALYLSVGPSLNATAANACYTRLTSWATYHATELVIEIFRKGQTTNFSYPTGYVLDRYEHTYGVAFDAAGTLHVLVDGVDVFQLVDVSNVIGAALDDSGLRCFAAYSDAPGLDGEIIVSELIYGWVPPTLLDVGDAFSFHQLDKIGFVGDSNFAGSPDPTFRIQAPLEKGITERYRVANAIPEPTYVNLGVGADTSTDVLARLAAIIAAGCNHYFHMYGLNDFFNHGGVPIPPATTAANYTAILNGLLTALPNSKHHVVSNVYAGSEQRPRGIGPDDASVDATNAAIVGAVALQPAASVRYLNTIPRLYTVFSPVVNPGNAANGVITQADGTHPSKVVGQNLWSRCVWDWPLTFAK